MRTTALAAMAAGSLLALSGTTVAAAAAPSTLDAGSSSAPTSHIVVLDDSAAARTVAAAHADRFDLDLRHVYTTAVRGYAAPMSATTAAAIEALPGVAWVQQDTAVRTTAQTTPTGIDRSDAELSPTAQIDGVDQRVDVDVAVIDTGVDLAHPDINVYRSGAKNCSIGAINANDLNGHGSHVAGTIGAVDNASGVVGMAPGARIWPVKVLTDAGSGLNSDVICGIDYVAANADEIEVANMSLGGAGEDTGSCGAGEDAMHAAICSAVDAGITFVVAAGNDSADAAEFTPAAYDEVITVSALADFDGAPGGAGGSTCRSDQDDTFASFSNYGADVDIIAPGVCIYSTSMLGGYATLSGTSMASPHVAGGAALYAASNPGATPAQVKSALLSAGTTDWDNSDDGDATKEPLLNVAGY